jgi:myosin heavy subunit
VLGAIESKPSGVLAILDEENRLPRGTNEGFLTKLLAQAAKDKAQVLQAPDAKAQRKNAGGNAARVFTVVHYAGPVTYDSAGFLEKNKDLLLPDLAAVGSKSSFKFLAKLINGSGTATR